MTGPIPLFVELCAGTAALSLRLHRDGARPPVSRMGAKTGYADTILRVLGLVPGQRAAAYLWCEPDPGVRLLLEAYRDAGLAKAAAGIIRGWADEDPRALWERLRAEGPPRCPDGGVEAGEVARVLQILASNELINVAWSDAHNAWRNTGAGGTTFGGPIGYGGDRVPGKLEALPVPLPAAIAPDARQVDPREVARWVWTWGRSYNTKGPDAGFLPSESSTGTPVWNAHPPEHFADAVGRLPTLPAAIHPDARQVDPGPALPPGTVAYMDPPYLNTTGYAADLPRAEVVAIARRWGAAGATVCISEAEAIPELVAEGWHAVRIDGERVGQRRTFSKQQAEWLTLNRPPAWRPSVQGGLFAPR